MIVEPDFLDHWKTRLLVQLTKDECAPLYLIRLWAHCQTRKTWRFREMKSETLGAICRCQIDENLLKTSLLAAGFLEEKNGTLVIHDFEKSNRALINSWMNGSKGGRPKKTRGLAVGYPRVTRGQPTPLSNLSSTVQGDLKGKQKNESDWIEELKTDPAFKGIDVEREHAKCVRWSKEHKVQPTRRRFINWLNRSDKPLFERKFKEDDKIHKYGLPL